jgi:hypothetical protein
MLREKVTVEVRVSQSLVPSETDTPLILPSSQPRELVAHYMKRPQFQRGITRRSC